MGPQRRNLFEIAALIVVLVVLHLAAMLSGVLAARGAVRSLERLRETQGTGEGEEGQLTIADEAATWLRQVG